MFVRGWRPIGPIFCEGVARHECQWSSGDPEHRNRETRKATFRTAEPALKDMLDAIAKGEMQLPDFQRGCVCVGADRKLTHLQR